MKNCLVIVVSASSLSNIDDLKSSTHLAKSGDVIVATKPRVEIIENPDAVLFFLLTLYQVSNIPDDVTLIV